MLDTDSTIQFYADLNGNPLQGGNVYFGVAGQNPVTSPITVYWDAAATQPAKQPITVKNGLTTRNGNAARVYLSSDYSKLVVDGLGRQVSFDASIAAPVRSALGAASGAGMVGFAPAGPNTFAAGTVGAKLQQIVSVKDAPYNAKGDGATDDTAALQAAVNASSTLGFVAYVPAGVYKHSGITFKNGSRLRGEGSQCVRLLNTSPAADSLLVPYFNDSVFFENWEMSGMTLDAQNIRSPSQAGFHIDTGRRGLVSDIVTQNHYYGWRERSSWTNTWHNVRALNNEYMALVESGTSTGGVPNYRFGVYGTGNTNGIDIQERGWSATAFVGGGIESCTNWALRIVGGANRALKFIGVNFEGNNNGAAGPDIILGDATSGPINVDFDSCQFTDRDLSADRFAFDLQRGSRLGIRNCNFLGYSKCANLTGTFGDFTVSGCGGLNDFAESATVGVMLPMANGLLCGTKTAAVSISSSGTARTWQQANANMLLASRRTTEGFDRFEIAADGTIGWHPFNTAAADVTLARLATGVLGTGATNAFRVGSGATGARPAAGTAGAGAVWYDTTLGKPIWSNGATWTDSSGAAV